MNELATMFKHYQVNFDNLVPYGFIKQGDKYVYQTLLKNEQFKLLVSINNEGQVKTQLLDIDLNEDYRLHLVPGSKGNYIGAIRQEYIDVLQNIIDNCFELDIFKSSQAKQIIEYVKKTYHDELQFLWKKSTNAVFKRQDNQKWYGAMLFVQKQKLGLTGDELIEIIDLRMKPDGLKEVVDHQKYFPGYHMNKSHWVTICLDDSVEMDEIIKRIDDSYDLANK